MSQATNIEWTDATWNPIRGCSRVSEGCRNCYAESVAYRFSGLGQPYEGLVRIGSDGQRRPEWNGEIRFVEEHLLDPLRWKPILGGFRPRRIFVNSMSDLFHENVTDEMLDRIFAVMALCPQHTFQVLTKRPENALRYLNAPGRRSDILDSACRLAFDLQSLKVHARIQKPSNATEVVYDCGVAGHEAGCRVHAEWPLPNVWLGVSVENQKAADERIPLLLETPAAVRFLSAEPLLGPVDLDDTHDWLTPGFTKWPERASHPALDWVICGGESGPGARPMHPDWARSLRDQCQAAGVPFFFKQWGEWAEVERRNDLPARPWMVRRDDTLVRPDGTTLRYDDCGGVDEAVPMRRVGKKAAGHLLDGEVIQQFPERAA